MSNTQTPRGEPRHHHPEAFMLMRYLAVDGSEDEIVWNSRDGVAPSVITLRSGKTAYHVSRAKEVCAPDHKPEPGTRIIVDLTADRAREFALIRAREAFSETFGETSGVPNVAYAIRQRWDTPEAMADELAVEYLSLPGASDLVEATS